MKKRFQNKVATGRLTLPVTVIYAVAISVIGGFIDSKHWFQLVILALSTLEMVAFSNNNSLIRVFSRMVSCTFLTFTLMNPQLMESVSGNIVQALFILTLILLFRAYQDRRATGTILYAFICIGIISTQFIQIAFFLPIIWAMMFTSLQEGSLRSLVASILGLIIPYWFWGAYCLHAGTCTALVDHFNGITEFAPIGEGLFVPNLLLPLILFTLLGVLGTLQFLRFAYADSIKTRMFYNVIMLMFFASIVFVVLQPQHSDYLLRMAIICVAPLVAHYFTFTNSWLTNALFYAMIATTLALTILNRWIF